MVNHLLDDCPWPLDRSCRDRQHRGGFRCGHEWLTGKVRLSEVREHPAQADGTRNTAKGGQSDDPDRTVAHRPLGSLVGQLSHQLSGGGVGRGLRWCVGEGMGEGMGAGFATGGFDTGLDGDAGGAGS